MLDINVPPLDSSQGERLARPAYRNDFRRCRTSLRGESSWKLERLQHFEEQNDPSRDALRRGDWDLALRLLEEEREGLLRSEQEDKRKAGPFHRVRVVEEPLTPYLQWELHALRIQAETGSRIRVVDVATVESMEAGRGLLPEMVVLGGRTLYHVQYTPEGIPDGARKYTDPGLIAPWEALISTLFADGENVISYVNRYVAHLPPPRLTTE
ncbi:DUF6879 family protein [Streptomyces sp. SBT349]|uniref:DUF6879 family protein n=1 Tax=Streptomyces sp. SBT349 TaxID=1580539 RepID=UPI00066C89C9|nr:DUF6879 family protein [Streptomyces sp. SBT349]